ncbi:alkaline phosphatase D family protein [Pelagibaculum spongiae]|uniref:PhoD-like phosphatase metallophosphatase domain-containing protein n=1 Tax=Pelagibaculum spongiae TaxID=2080658 RepID=A0A2V1GSL3_9GAMM|nr:alkaline phosphatase D family protein [Pelagibaculum spongiae]PVZ66356.1 hypothetical protein DC094_16800 [Pelagibaculum spongiae]
MNQVVSVSLKSAASSLQSAIESSWSRRDFLKATAAAAALLLIGCKVDTDQKVKEFPLGVAAADPEGDNIQLWTQYIGKKDLRLMLWLEDDVDLQNPLLNIEVSPNSHGYVQLQINDLQPGERYMYSFVEFKGSKSTQVFYNGRFRSSLPQGAIEPVRFAAGSCASNYMIPFTLEKAGLRRNLDAFIFLGDTSYNDSASDPESYRKIWSKNLKKRGFQRVRSANCQISTWDDHEIVNDWDPETIDPTLLRHGLDAYFEHMPVKRNPQRPDQIWRKLSFGDTVDVFVLDSRSDRRPSTMNTPEAQYLSVEQLAWLKRGLNDSSAVFKLIVNSVPISHFPGVLFDSGEAQRWSGYASQRADILNYIEGNQIPGVLWLAGDVHFAAMGRVDKTGPGSRSTEVTVGPFCQVINPLGGFLPRSQFDWCAAVFNYVELAFEPATGEVEVIYRGDFDNELARKTYKLV